MIAYFHYVHYILTLLVVTLTLGFIWYKKYVRVYTNFPSCNFLVQVLKCTLMSKVPKHIPVTSFYFQFLIEKCKQFQSEGMCLIWILQPYLFIFNEESMKVFSNEATTINKPYNIDILQEFSGKGLVTIGGDLWRRKRKMLNPVFYTPVLMNKAGMIDTNAKILVKKLFEYSEQGLTDIKKFLNVCACTNIYEFLTGEPIANDISSSEIDTVMDAVNGATEMVVYRILHPWLHHKFMMRFFSKGREFSKRVEDGLSVSKKIVEKMKKADDAEREQASDLEERQNKSRRSLRQIIFDHHRKDPTYTLQDIQDELTELLTAGFDTVSYGMMWSLFLLGHHPEIQDRAYDELEILMGSFDDLPYDKLPNLKYLECIIKESLRLYPPVPLYARRLTKDIQCGKYTVPEGTNIVFCVYLAHRDPNMFPDPEKFDPERFLEGNADKKLLTYAFSEGVRNCIGKKFALMEMKIILAHIIKNFKITSLDRREDINLSWEIVLAPVEKLRICLTPR